MKAAAVNAIIFSNTWVANPGVGARAMIKFKVFLLAFCKGLFVRSNLWSIFKIVL